MALSEDSERLFQKRRHLETCRENTALFDSKRWVTNFEAGLITAWKTLEGRCEAIDIAVEDKEPIY